MKRLFLLFVFLLPLAASCTKNVVLESNPELEIGFGTYQGRSTKADPDGFADTARLPEGSSFGVFAFFHPGTTLNPGSWHTVGQQNHPNLMLNQRVDVSRDASDNDVFTYTPAKYWPSEGTRISFYAYYPFVSDGYYYASGVVPGSTARYMLGTYMNKDTNGQGSFGFDVAYEAKDQIDLMVSDLCADQNKKEGRLTSTDASGTVRFDFHHVLSQVRINTLNVENNNPAVTITPREIRFDGIAVGGEDWSTYNASTGKVTNTFTWTDQRTDRIGNQIRGVHVDYTGAKRPGESDEEYAVRQKQNYLMMVPQTFSEEAMITVIYDVVRSDTGSGEHYSYTGNEVSAKLNTAKIAGSSTVLSGWAPNKIYNYTVTIGLNGIQLSASYVDWTEAGGDYDLE